MSRRAGLYLRISKDWKGDSAGVDRQREDGARLIEQRGWTYVETYVDNDITASGRRKRPDYQRMLADLEAGRVDAVVARSIERLFKSRREQLTFMELGQELRTPVAFTHAPDIDFNTAVGRGIADMQAAWARVEMEQKAERHRDQAAQVARRGLPHGSRRAFGYTRDGLNLDPSEAPLLQVMYTRWLTGESMASIATWLNDSGSTTVRGFPWTHNSVRDVLSNCRNAGLRGIREVVDHRTGRRARWARIVGPAQWPAAVSEETWQAAVARIKDPRRQGAHTGHNRLSSLLSGIARCGVGIDGSHVSPDDPDFDRKACGRAMTTTGATRERSLRCPSLTHATRRADLIEDYVQEAVIEYFRRPDVPALAARRAPAASPIDVIRAESIELRARLDGLARDYADGILDRAGVKTAGDRIRARLDELDGQIAAAGQVDVTASLRATDDPERVWDSLPLTTQREVIRRVATVHILRGYPGRPRGLRFHPETVRLHWRA